MVVLTFSVLNQKYPFYANLYQKIKIVSLTQNLVPRHFEYVKFDGDIHFFCFRPFFPNFVQKIHSAF